MRIQFGRRIKLCNNVTYSGHINKNRYLIIATTCAGSVYSIVIEGESRAKKAYQQLLELGYYDASNDVYSN